MSAVNDLFDTRFLTKTHELVTERWMGMTCSLLPNLVFWTLRKCARLETFIHPISKFGMIPTVVRLVWQGSRISRSRTIERVRMVNSLQSWQIGSMCRVSASILFSSSEEVGREDCWEVEAIKEPSLVVLVAGGVRNFNYLVSHRRNLVYRTGVDNGC